MEKPGHAALRRGRWSNAGQVYFVTFATHGRKRHFGDAEIAADASRAIADANHWQRSHLLAWVLMPDHWHGLVELGRMEALSTCIGGLKGRSARLVRRLHPQLGPVWAPAFQDRALRNEEALVDVARYIVLNPVRAGLVRRAGDWPYWDAVWL